MLAGRTIGFAGLYVMGDGLEHSGWVLIGVREAFQARGVGPRLLKTLLGAATVVFGLRRVQLTVFDDNEPAIKLYRRFGFEIEGRHRDFIRRNDGFVDGYTMARLRGPARRSGPPPEAARYAAGFIVGKPFVVTLSVSPSATPAAAGRGRTEG